MSKRVEGQIWIDKNLPYKLKYRTNNEDFVVETASSYKFQSNPTLYSSYDIGDTFLPAGLLVKLNSSGEVERAIFPDDLETVIGILSTNVKKISENEVSSAIVSRNGYLTIDEPWKVFKEFEALSESSTDSDYKNALPGTSSTQSVSDKYTTIIGKPVYWYIGKTTDTSYTPATSDEAGKLTFSTPVGFVWDGKTASLNVAYDNLPQVGTLVKIENGKVYLHLNFSKFDSTIEWTWPGVHYSNGDCGKIGPTLTENGDVREQASEKIIICHGLFANSSSNYHKVRSFCDIVALDKHEPDNENEYLVQAPVKNKITGNDRYTEITISSPETLYYRISGRINYKFDKGGK